MSRAVQDTVVQVVERYIGKWRRAGNQNIVVGCPFHEQAPGHHTFTLSISTTHGSWLCFSCGAGGGFPLLLKELGVEKHLRDLILEPVWDEMRRGFRPREVHLNTDIFRAEHLLPEAVLGVYEYCPTSLVASGFDEGLLQSYDVGFDYSHQRMTWPVRDVYGGLAGIFGRNLTGGFPKYKAYTIKDFDFEVQARYPHYEFKKSNHLWNLDRVHSRLYHSREPAIVVLCEGFKAALWCIQHGWPFTVAQMGTWTSYIQAEFLRRIGGTVILFLDNNPAGFKGALSAYEMLRRSNTVYFAQYPCDEDLQPDSLAADELEQAIEAPLTRNHWIHESPLRLAAWREHELQKARRTREEARP